MKLSGNYSHEDLARALQGNFACREFTKNSKGKPLPEDEQYIRLELFFIALEIYPNTGKLVISKIKDDDKGSTQLTPLLTLEAGDSEENHSNGPRG